MIRSIARATRREEGVAMVMAVVLSAVVMTLAVMSLSVATHTDNASARGRHWVQALHVAESGIEQAIAKIQAASGNYSGPFVGTTDSGQYVVSVTRSARNHYTIESTGSVREGRRLAATRKLRVTMAPPAVFKNALFSYTTVVTKNNDVVNGDVWANQNVILAQGTVVTGSVTGATGYVRLENGARVDGNVTSGGYDALTARSIAARGTSQIGGNAESTVVNPPDPITCGGANPDDYSVYVGNGGSIVGSVRTWGTKTGPGTVTGTLTSNICLSAPATQPMPTFTYSADNYDPDTLHEFGTPEQASPNAVSAFHAYLTNVNKRISGTFYINQEAPVGQSNRIDLTGVVITGDTTIVTNTPIFTNGTSDDTTDGIVLLASFYRPPTDSFCNVDDEVYSECAVFLKNNFQPSCAVALLVYAPHGPTAIKNNQTTCGAVYSDSIDVKNNQTMTYDARIERQVGFGPVTLEITRWLEVKP